MVTIRSVVLGSAAGCLLMVGACTPQTSPGPAAPKITSFAAAGSPFVSPNMVPLAWKVSDANGDDLTCRLDVEDDGTWDLTIGNCDAVGGVGSRLVTAGVGGHTSRLQVSDTTHITTATTSFVVEPESTSEGFDIELRPLESLEPDEQAAFDAAVSKWESAVVRGVPDDVVTLDPGQCLDSEPGGTLNVDDLVLTVEITPIDGAGGTLGQAGPCVVSSADYLSRAGIMQFDSADVSDMLADGTFAAVVAHEIGHVLGIGTVWSYGRSLLNGAATSNPQYDGVWAMAEFSALGGSAAQVPVENTGGSGTVDSHWREATFANELMTGWISPVSNPLSAMTVSSLADLGYAVDRSVADPYTLPGGAGVMAPGRPTQGSVDTSRMGRPPITVQ